MVDAEVGLDSLRVKDSMLVLPHTCAEGSRYWLVEDSRVQVTGRCKSVGAVGHFGCCRFDDTLESPGCLRGFDGLEDA